MADITYCSNTVCPFKECERYPDKISEAAINGRGYVSVTDFSGVCRDYIGYLVDNTYNEVVNNGCNKRSIRYTNQNKNG